jgi:perosamine synthetase
MRAIPRQRIHWPSRAWRRTWRCWRNGALWDGPAIARLERRYEALLHVAHAVGVPSGRVGLACVLEALELPQGGEVICPAFGYPAVPFVAQSLGLRVRFVDCELDTLGMDPDALRTALSRHTGAVIAAHLFGVPCRIREISEIARAHDVALIEDCAHGLRGSLGSRHVGTFGVAGYFSFETSKLVNTLGGGMVVMHDAKLAERLRARLALQPRNGGRWLLGRLLRTALEATATQPLVFGLLGAPLLRLAQRTGGMRESFSSGCGPDEINFEGREGQYTNLQAELGLAELERGLGSLERRRSNVARLHERLGARLPVQRCVDASAIADYLLCTVRLPDLEHASRRLLALGVDTKHHYMRDCARLFDPAHHCPRAARAEREVLHVPAYPELDDDALERVAGALLCVAQELEDRVPRDAPALADVG